MKKIEIKLIENKSSKMFFGKNHNLTYVGKDEHWTSALFDKTVEKDKIFKFVTKIHRSKNARISIGIADIEKEKENRWCNDKNCIYYYG